MSERQLISAQFSIPSAIIHRVKNFNFVKCATNHLSSTKMWMRYSDCIFFSACIACYTLNVLLVYSVWNLFLVFSHFLVSVGDWYKMRIEYSLFIFNWLRLRRAHLRHEHFYFDYNRCSRWRFRWTRLRYRLRYYNIIDAIVDTEFTTLCWLR